MSKSAPIFAKKLREALKFFLKKPEASQRQMAKRIDLSLASFNRIYKSGIGSEDNICVILSDILHLNKRRILEMLAARRSELSDGKAKKCWGNFKYAFVNEDEYITDMCPVPLSIAYASTNYGIDINELVEVAKQAGITDIQDMGNISLGSYYQFLNTAENKFGTEAVKEIVSMKSGKYAPIINFEFSEIQDAEECIKLVKCRGKVLFGLPHLVIADYNFDEGGIIVGHNHDGGVEMLYSIAGKYKVKCDGKECDRELKAQNSIFIFQAKYDHQIQIVDDAPGRLLLARFYPTKRNLRSDRSKKKKNVRA